MKTPILTLCAAASVLGSISHAQTTDAPVTVSPFRKGTVTLGMNLGTATRHWFPRDMQASGATNDVTLHPSGGYFVTEHILVSAGLTGTFRQGGVMRTNSVGVGLGARYYFGNAQKANGDVNRLRWYVGADGSFTHGRARVDWGDSVTTSRSSAVSVNAGIGANYLISNNVALESGLGTHRQFFLEDNGLRAGNLQLSVGMRVFLNRNATGKNAAALPADGQIAVRKAISPISRGGISVGTTISDAAFSLGKKLDDKRPVAYQITLRPSAGYMLTDHWMLKGDVGLRIQGGSSKNHRVTSTGAGLGLAARYYIGRPETSLGAIRKLRVFAEVGGSYDKTFNSGVVNGVREKNESSNLLLRAGAGINYLLSDNLAFEAMASRRRDIFGSSLSETHITTMQLELGFRLFLSRK